MKGQQNMNRREATIVNEVFEAIEIQGTRAIRSLVEEEPRLLHCKSATGETFLHIAVERANFDLVSWLIDKGIWLDTQNNNGNTALYLAIDNRWLEEERHRVIHLLLDAGADPDLQDKYQTSPIALATMKNDVETIHALATAGANLNAQWGKEGYTLLYYALISRHNEVIPPLLEVGASATALTKYGDSALHFAIERDMTAMVALLLSGRSNLNVRNRTGLTPLAMAVKSNKMAYTKMLLEAGADPNVRTSKDKSLLDPGYPRPSMEMARLLLSHGYDPNGASKTGGTDLMEFAYRDDTERLKLFLDFGADISLKNNMKRDAFLAAILCGHHQSAEILAQHGADVHIRDEFGHTALHNLVSFHDEPEMVEWLLQQGVDPTPLDEFGKTALDTAIEKERTASITVLQGCEKRNMEVGANV
jgi:uncharacterized protein